MGRRYNEVKLEPGLYCVGWTHIKGKDHGVV